MHLLCVSRLLIVFVCIVLLFSPCQSTLSKKDKKKNTKDKGKKVAISYNIYCSVCIYIIITKAQIALTTVTERGLVTEKPKWKEIVKNHNLYSSEHNSIKSFAGMTLGYVTPVRWGCVRGNLGSGCSLF